MNNCITEEEISSFVRYVFKERDNASIIKYDPSKLTYDKNNEDIFLDLFNKNTRENAFNTVKEIVKHADIYIPFKIIFEKNVSDLSEEKLKDFFGEDSLTIRNTAIALTTIIGTQRSYKDIAFNKNIDDKEGRDPQTDLFYLDANNLEQVIGMNIAKSMNFVSVQTTKTERAKLYAKLGKVALERLIDNGYLEIEDNAEIVYNDQLDYEKIKTASNINATQQKYSDKKTYRARAYRITNNLFKNRKSLDYIFQTNKYKEIQEKEIQENDFICIAEISRAINKIITPSEIRSPLTKPMGYDEFKEFYKKHSDINTFDEDKIKVLHEIHKSPMYLTKEIIPLLVKIKEKVDEGKAVYQAVEDITNNNKDMINSILGKDFYDNLEFMVSFKKNIEGRDRTAYNNIANLIYNLDKFIEKTGDGSYRSKPIFFTPYSIRTDRIHYYENVLNFQTDKKFSRQILTSIKNEDKDKYAFKKNSIEETNFIMNLEDIGGPGVPKYVKTIKTDPEFAENFSSWINEAFKKYENGNIEELYNIVLVFSNSKKVISSNDKIKKEESYLTNMNNFYKSIRLLIGLRDLAEAYKNKETDEIKTAVNVELDASTSGIMLKALQSIGVKKSKSLEILNTIGFKLKEKTDNNKNMKSFDDIYRLISGELVEDFREMEEKSDTYRKIKDITGNKIVPDTSLAISKIVYDYITQNINIDTRELVKSPTMTVGSYAQDPKNAARTSMIDINEEIIDSIDTQEKLDEFKEMLLKIKKEIKNSNDKFNKRLTNSIQNIIETDSIKDFQENDKIKNDVLNILENTIGKYLAGLIHSYISKEMFGSLHDDIKTIFETIAGALKDNDLKYLKVLPPSVMLSKEFKIDKAENGMIKSIQIGGKQLTKEDLAKYGMPLKSVREAINNNGHTLQVEVPNIYSAYVSMIHAIDSYNLFKSQQKTLEKLGVFGTEKNLEYGVQLIHDAINTNVNYHKLNEIDYIETTLESARDYDIREALLVTAKLIGANVKKELISKIEEEINNKREIIDNYLKENFEEIKNNPFKNNIYGFKENKVNKVLNAEPLNIYKETDKSNNDKKTDNKINESYQKNKKNEESDEAIWWDIDVDNNKKEAYQREGQSKLRFNKELSDKIVKKLKEIYPYINIDYSLNEKGIIGKADLEALTVFINKEKQTTDTVPHEFAHIYINWFKDTPIVKAAVEKYGNIENLVQAIGEQVVEQKGEAFGWWKKFIRWIKKKLDLRKKEKEELKNILTDAFLMGKDLNEVQYEAESSWRPSYKKWEPKKENEDIFTKLNYRVNDFIVDTIIIRTEMFGKQITNSLLKKQHDKLMKTSPLYKDVVNFLKDIRNSEVVVSTLEWLDLSDFKNKKDKNDFISYMHRLLQEKNKITTTYIKDLDILLKSSFKNKEGHPDIDFIADLDDIYSRSGIHFLIESNKELYEKLVTGETTVKEAIEVYKRRVKDNFLIETAENISKMFMNGIVEGWYRYDNFEFLKISNVQKTNLSVLTSLFALQTIPNVEEKLKRLVSVPKAHDKIVEAAQATIAMHKKLFEVTRDYPSYRGNLTHDYFENNYEFKIITKKEFDKGILSKDSRWKILRKPEANKLGIAYKAIDMSSQPGIGTDVRYNIDGLIINDKYYNNRNFLEENNAVVTYIGREKYFKTLFTKEEKEKLGLIKNPAQTLIRTYAHLKFILESQVIRDELVKDEYLFKINNKKDIDELVEKIKNREVDFSWFIKLGDNISYEDLPNEIKEKYKIADRITKIKEMDKEISLVRKDIAYWLIGYNDVDIFKNSPTLNKVAQFLRKAVIMTKINWVVNNPVKLLKDLISNYIYLLSVGVPAKDIYRYSIKALDELNDLEKLKSEIVALKFLVDANPNNLNLKAKLKTLQDKLKNHRLAPIYYNGMIQSLSTDIILKDFDTISGLQHDLIKFIDKIVKDNQGELNSIGKWILKMSKAGIRIEDILEMLSNKMPKGKVTNSVKKWMEETAQNIREMKDEEDVSRYITQFMGAPGSEITKVGSTVMQYSDIISRVILLQHYINKGMKEEDAILEVLNSFIDYKVNMPKELKWLSDYGILLFPSFWARIQKVIFNLARKHPVNFVTSYVFEEMFNMNGLTIVDSNIFTKFDNGILHTPPVGLDSILPTKLIPGI